MRIDAIGKFTGIKICDINRNALLDKTWVDRGDWSEKIMPPNQDIIGLTVNRVTNGSHIKSITFMAWRYPSAVSPDIAFAAGLKKRRKLQS